MENSQSKLIITRASAFVNKLRNVSIYVNDKEVGTIADGETKEFEIESGAITVRANIDWCSSQKLELNAQPNSVIKLALSNNVNALTGTFVMLVNPTNYMKLVQVS